MYNTIKEVLIYTFSHFSLTEHQISLTKARKKNTKLDHIFQEKCLLWVFFFLNCQPNMFDCFKIASGIYLETITNGGLVYTPFLMLIYACKHL